MSEPNNFFWVVWQPEHGPFTYRHPSHESAKGEAQRLARVNPGKRFYLLQCYGYLEKHDVDFVEFERELPF